MKRFIYLFIAAFAITSCQKDPDMDDLDNDFLVYTSYDAKADIASFTNYVLPDSILLIGSGNKAEYWKGEDAQEIIDAFVAGMDGRGYTRVTEKDQADLGIQLSYVKQVTYYVGYDSPYWWYYYPYYWAPGYWGNWYGWYYPYAVYYGYTSGSMLAEAVDLKAEQGAGHKLPVVWNAFLGGLLGSSGRYNLDRTLQAVDQAFVQSPYLKK